MRVDVALVILSYCVASAPAYGASMTGLPTPTPKFIRAARAYWWSPTKPEGETFELPSAVKTCAVIKVRFVGQVIQVSSRTGAFPAYATVTVEDNFGDSRYSTGSQHPVDFYNAYNDVPFGRSNIEGVRAIHVDREDELMLLYIGAATLTPETASNYVCLFHNGQRLTIAYFLRKMNSRSFSP